MKLINLKIEIDTKKLDEQTKNYFKENGYLGMFEMLLVQGLSSLNPQGLGMKDGRSFNRIQKSIDESVKASIDSINVENAEFDLLKKVFLGDETKFHPTAFNLVCQFADCIEEASKNKEK
jgi:hypothetical protein